MNMGLLLVHVTTGGVRGRGGGHGDADGHVGLLLACEVTRDTCTTCH